MYIKYNIFVGRFSFKSVGCNRSNVAIVHKKLFHLDPDFLNTTLNAINLDELDENINVEYNGYTVLCSPMVVGWTTILECYSVRVLTTSSNTVTFESWVSRKYTMISELLAEWV